MPDHDSTHPERAVPGPDPAFVEDHRTARAYWQVGTYWKVLATGDTTNGRACVFDELVPHGLVAPVHTHDDEDEAFFVLEGEFIFTVGDTEIAAGPGDYIYLPPQVPHGFRCLSPVGRLFNTLTPAGFEHGVLSHGTAAPEVTLPPPGVSALQVWTEQLDPHRPPAPWAAPD